MAGHKSGIDRSWVRISLSTADSDSDWDWTSPLMPDLIFTSANDCKSIETIRSLCFEVMSF